MMINRRLIGAVPESRKYIAGNVAAQWVSLVTNMLLMAGIAGPLQSLHAGTAGARAIGGIAVLGLCALAVRFTCALAASRMGYLSAKAVKSILREAIYQKLLRLGASYAETVRTSEVVQVAVEGVDQLETYFGAYLPQFFYAMLVPLTLFCALCFVNVPSAVVPLVCVPMIPVAIAAVQTWAKKLLSKYWGQYTALGDTFLENLQGMTTMKIYQTDGLRHRSMNEESENFRRITMKVLTMQLNSITIMDLIAYGGTALGMIMAVTQLRAGNVSIGGSLLIILLSADFFLPMRQLGSFFHIAMNGMAASDKIFRLLDLPEQHGGSCYPRGCDITVSGLHFSYDGEREVLRGVDMTFLAGSFTALVGESGCGKSTMAAILTGKNRNFTGRVAIGGVPISEIKEDALMQTITYIDHAAYLFSGTVRENLLMGRPDASEEELWNVLEKVNLADFLKNENGLDTLLTEQATSPADKGSGWPSRGRCCTTARCTSLTKLPPTLMWRAKMTSWRRFTRWQRPKPSS